MSKDDVLSLDNQLCFAFYTCSREIIKVYKPYLDELGLTYTQYITMLVLWEDPITTIKELGSRLYLDSGTLTPLLKKLETAGFIERKRDPADERSVIITLTEKGMSMKKAAVEIPAKVFCHTGLSLEEAVALKERIKNLIHHMNPRPTE